MKKYSKEEKFAALILQMENKMRRIGREKTEASEEIRNEIFAIEADVCGFEFQT